MTFSFFQYFFPDIIVFISGFFSLMACFFKRMYTPKYASFLVYVLSIIFFVAGIVSLFLLPGQEDRVSISIFNDMYSQIYIFYIIKSVCLICMFFVLFSFGRDIKHLSKDQLNIEYVFFLLISLMGSFIILSSHQSFITLFLGLEMQAISGYVLASFPRGSSSSARTAIYYFILGSLGSFFFLLGAVLLYSSLDYSFIDFTKPDVLISLSEHHDLFLPYVLMAVAILIKVGCVPFHAWVPMLYRTAMNSFVIFSVSIGKLSLMSYFLFIFKEHLSYFHFLSFENISYPFGVMCFFFGIFGAYVQKNIMSLLAYSSIVSLGYVFFSGYTSIAFLFLFIYAVTTSGFLLCIHSIRVKRGGITSIDSLSSVGIKKPIVGIVLTIYLFSLIGIPPFFGFFTKFLIIYSLIDVGYNPLLVVIFTFIGAFYYLRLVQIIWFPSEQQKKNIIDISLDKVCFFVSFLISCFVIFGSFLVYLAFRKGYINFFVSFPIGS